MLGYFAFRMTGHSEYYCTIVIFVIIVIIVTIASHSRIYNEYHLIWHTTKVTLCHTRVRPLSPCVIYDDCHLVWYTSFVTLFDIRRLSPRYVYNWYLHQCSQNPKMRDFLPQDSLKFRISPHLSGFKPLILLQCPYFLNVWGTST